jgi:hypothetical protein
MAIATTVVTETFVGATLIVTSVFMTTQLRSATLLQGVEYRKLVVVGMMGLAIISPKTFDNLSHFQFATAHGLFG